MLQCPEWSSRAGSWPISWPKTGQSPLSVAPASARRPEYRITETATATGSTRNPSSFTDFVKNVASRKRYWARSYVGWQRFSKARPNAAHYALAGLEATGKVDTLITQNVDRLHSAAGSRRVIDLHGDLSKVRCLTCQTAHTRLDYQRALKDSQPRLARRGFPIQARRRCRACGQQS